MHWKTTYRSTLLATLALVFGSLALAGGLTAAAGGAGLAADLADAAVTPSANTTVAPSAPPGLPDDHGYLWASADDDGSGYIWGSSVGWDGQTSLGAPSDWLPRQGEATRWGDFE